LAAAAGMAHDLGITGEMSSLIGSMFFLGYFFCQIPGAAYAQRHGIRRLVFASVLAEGCVAALTGVVANPHALLLVRFTLGVAEAAVIPAMLIYLSKWFTRAERSRANTILLLGNPITVLWMSVVSGYLIQALDWRWMFIIEGVPAIGWAFLWRMMAKEGPADAPWLSNGEKLALADTIAQEQSSMKPMRNYRQAFKSANVIFLCLQYFFWSAGCIGFVIWLPSILQAGSTMGIVATGWLSSAPYLLAIAVMLAASYASDRMSNRKLFVWPLLLTAALAFYGSYLLGPSHFWLSFTLLVVAGAGMYAPFGIFFAIIPEILPQNVAGGAIALINSMGALGSFAGSYLVGYLNGATGGPGASFLTMAAALAIAVVMTLLIRPEGGGRAQPISLRVGSDLRSASVNRA